MSSTQSHAALALARSTWEVFYKQAYGMRIDLSGLIIPTLAPEFEREHDHEESHRVRLVINCGMNAERAFHAFKTTGICEKISKWVDDLDEAILDNERTSKTSDEPYAIWVLDTQPAYPVSAQELWENWYPTETCTEHLIDALKMAIDAGRAPTIPHQGKKSGWTLCAGSRALDKSGEQYIVPAVRFRFRGNAYEMGIVPCMATFRSASIQARRVIY